MPQTISTNVSGRLAKEKIEGRGGAWRLMIFSLFIFAVFLISYLGLVFGYKPFVNAQIAGKDKEIQDLAATVSAQDQANYIKFYHQLKNLQSLLRNHVISSKLFPLLESHTNQKVAYTSLTVDVKEARVVLEAIAQSYDAVAQQLQAYQTMPEVSRYLVSSTQLGEQGKVRFSVTLFLNPQIFKS